VESEKYQKAWENYKRRKWLCGFSFVFLAFMQFGIFYIKDNFTEPYQKLLFTILLAGWGFAIASLLYVQAWKCPRCKQIYHHLFRRFIHYDRCKNCGLNKYEGSNLHRKRIGKRFGF